MTDIQSLACQIKHNCNISDARYWGMYSLCGLLLRLRELYKVEKGIRPWGKHTSTRYRRMDNRQRESLAGA